MLYAIKTSPQHTRFEDMLAVWQAADDLPVFHSAWNFDHFYPINVDDTSGPCLEAWTTLSALAQATNRIRVGCLVSGVVYRHPALIANMIASVDAISNGRLELGLGAGWSEEECQAYGFELGSLRERFDRFDESCEVISKLLTQETTTFRGKYYQLDNARCNPKPVQSELPWCIGGNGEKRTLPNVVKWANHWNYAAFDVEGFVAKRAVLHTLCKQAGRAPEEILTSAHILVNPASLTEAEELAHQFRNAGLGMAIFYLQPPHSADLLQPLADMCHRLESS